MFLLQLLLVLVICVFLRLSWCLCWAAVHLSFNDFSHALAASGSAAFTLQLWQQSQPAHQSFLSGELGMAPQQRHKSAMVLQLSIQETQENKLVDLLNFTINMIDKRCLNDDTNQPQLR